MSTTDVPRLSEVTAAKTRDLLSLDFARYLSIYAQSHGNAEEACTWYLERFPTSFGASYVKAELRALELSTKAAVPPATTGDSQWGAPLVGIEQLASGFLQLARSSSLLARVPGLRRIPFNVKIPYESQGPNFSWVAEGGAKPVSQMVFNAGVILSRLKASGLVIFTAELVKGIEDTATATALRDTLTAALTTFTDQSFLDPLSTAITGVRPASITAGLTPVTGGTGSLNEQVQVLIRAFFAANPGAENPVIIANGANATEIQGVSLMMPAKSVGVEVSFGLQVIPSAAAGNHVVVLDPVSTFFADDGVSIDYSSQAAIQLNDAPDSPPTASTVVASLWQANLIGFRCERFLNWWAAPNAVQYLTYTPA